MKRSDFLAIIPEIEVQLWWKGRKIGDCYMTSFNVHNDMIETTCKDNDSAKVMSPGHQSIQIEATVDGPLDIYED